MNIRTLGAALTLGLMGTLCPAAPASSPATNGPANYSTRLTSVAFEVGSRQHVVGDGRVEIMLDGRTAIIKGEFAGLSAPATQARIFEGAGVGVPGKPILDLVATLN